MAKPAVCKLDNHIGSRIRQLRKLRHISALKLAEHLNTTQQQISRYENGNNKIGASQLYKIAEALDAPVSWFYMGAETATNTIESPPGVVDMAPHRIDDELQFLNASWNSLRASERDALLKLVDAFLAKPAKQAGLEAA